MIAYLQYYSRNYEGFLIKFLIPFGAWPREQSVQFWWHGRWYVC